MQSYTNASWYHIYAIPVALLCITHWNVIVHLTSLNSTWDNKLLLLCMASHFFIQIHYNIMGGRSQMSQTLFIGIVIWTGPLICCRQNFMESLSRLLFLPFELIFVNAQRLVENSFSYSMILSLWNTTKIRSGYTPVPQEHSQFGYTLV